MSGLNPKAFRDQLDDQLAVRSVQEAVRINSVFGNEEEIGEYFADLIKSQGIPQVELHEVQEGRSNVVGILRGERPGPAVVVQGHMDTVPPGNHPEPFSGALRDGRIWGRGASDMKGPLVAGVLAVGLAKKVVGDLRGTCTLIGTIDEESEKRGMFGIVDRGLRADYGINVEPTDLRVAVAQKGCVSLRVTTHGIAAHGANPERGVNAIEKMADVIQAIKEAPRPGIEVPGVGTVSGTYSVGVIQGGQMFFIVPDTCSIWIDRRTVPGESQEEALEELRRVVAEVDTEAEVIVERQDWTWERIRKRGIGSCRVDPESPVVKAVVEGVDRVLDERAQFHVQTAWCETDFLVNDLSIPTVNFGPGKMELAHTSEEHIEVGSLTKGISVLAWAIARLCGNPGS
jgi:acetylornithine deacetylase/succinyl-diaminopimelate desuccinylase family protein